MGIHLLHLRIWELKKIEKEIYKEDLLKKEIVLEAMHEAGGGMQSNWRRVRLS
jgi:hypothetical protein